MSVHRYVVMLFVCGTGRVNTAGWDISDLITDGMNVG